MPLLERFPAIVSLVSSPAPASPTLASVAPLPSRPARTTAPAGTGCLRRAEKQIAAGSHTEAVASLRRAMQRGADAYACLLRITEVYEAARQWPQALDAAEAMVMLAPERCTAWERLLTLAMRCGQRHIALRAAEALIQIAPHCLPAHQARAEIYTALGQTEAALRAVSVLIRLDPTNGAHQISKGLLLQHQGETGLAVLAFMQAMYSHLDAAQAEIAMEALGTLDAHQMNQIVILAMEDATFRVRLIRDAVEAVQERGFILSPIGQHMVMEFCEQALPDMPKPSRPLRYN